MLSLPVANNLSFPFPFLKKYSYYFFVFSFLADFIAIYFYVFEFMLGSRVILDFREVVSADIFLYGSD